MHDTLTKSGGLALSSCFAVKLKSCGREGELEFFVEILIFRDAEHWRSDRIMERVDASCSTKDGV
jgi:hypothetical protein